MKLGVITSLWAYANFLPVVDTLDRIASLGIRHVDILGILHGHPDKLDDSERREIRARISSNNLILGSVILLPPGNIASYQADEIEACMQYVKAGIDLSAELGGKQVLFNGGKRSFDLPHAQSWDNAVSFLSQAADYAQEKGIDITVEAEPYVYFLVNDFDTTQQMVQQVDHPNLLAALDIGHMNLSRDEPGLIADIKDWLGRVHFSENDGLLHDNAILGTGTVHYPKYLEALLEPGLGETAESRGYDLCAVMELGVLGDPILDPDDWAARSLAHIARLAPELDPKGVRDDRQTS